MVFKLIEVGLFDRSPTIYPKGQYLNMSNCASLSINAKLVIDDLISHKRMDFNWLVPTLFQESKAGQRLSCDFDMFCPPVLKWLLPTSKRAIKSDPEWFPDSSPAENLNAELATPKTSSLSPPHLRAVRNCAEPSCQCKQTHRSSLECHSQL